METDGAPTFREVMNSETVRQVIDTMLDGFIADPQDKTAVIDIAAEILNGKTMGQGFGLTEQHLDLIMGLAAQQYAAGHYPQAIKLYGFVASMNQFHAGALKGLAMSHRQLGILKEALRYYGLSLLLEPEDMESVLMVAECLYRLGKNQEALQIVQQVLDRQSDPAARINKLPALLERAHELKKLLRGRSQDS